MKITLSVNDEVLRKVRQIAMERNTTLNALIRSYLEDLAEGTSRNRQGRFEALEKSFQRVKLSIGERTWKRADLHERS